MDVQGKVWGETSLIFLKSNVEVHRIVGVKGGFSSKHRHLSKYNKFFIESGSMIVRVWQDYGLVDETTLGFGQTLVVPPGKWHQFEVLETDTVAYEFYWTNIEQGDIEREGHGGVLEDEENPAEDKSH